MAQLFIPQKIHVGFQNREDTFNGKLAYVIYEDEKGNLRKETSWNQWRDEKLGSEVLDNIPTKFVLNKAIYHHNWDWHSSSHHKIRMFDQRGIEVEITPENLIGILMHSDVSKRDIVEEMVYAWNGKDLVLLPVNSEEYQKAKAFTQDQSIKISTKNLVVGQIYQNKKQQDNKYVYLGYYQYYKLGDPKYASKKYRELTSKNEYPTKNGFTLNLKGFLDYGKKHIFLSLNKYEDKYVDIPISSLMPVGIEQENYQKDLSDFLNSYWHKGLNDFDFIKVNKKINEIELNTYNFMVSGKEIKRSYFVLINNKYCFLGNILEELMEANNDYKKHFELAFLKKHEIDKNVLFEIAKEDIFFKSNFDFKDNLLYIFEKLNLKNILGEECLNKILNLILEKQKILQQKDRYDTTIYKIEKEFREKISDLIKKQELEVYEVQNDKM